MAHISIIHFNDVYNVDSTTTKEPIGGAARFLTAVKTYQQLNPLILFSGDAFSPSMRKYFDKMTQLQTVNSNDFIEIFSQHIHKR